MKKLLDLKLIVFVAILTVALIFIGVDFIESQVKTQGKPDKPPGKKGGGGHETLDMPAIAVFTDLNQYAVQSDSLGGYEDDLDRVTCFVGRKAGQFVLTTSPKYTSGRMLFLNESAIPQGRSLPDDPPTFGGYHVAEMVTGGAGSSPVLPAGEDLRFMVQPFLGGPENYPYVGLQLLLYDENRQNLWILIYEDVTVTPLRWDERIDENGNFIRDVNEDGYADAVEWEITAPQGTAAADVTWNKWWQNPIPYGLYDVPFHLKVTLLSAPPESP